MTVTDTTPAATGTRPFETLMAVEGRWTGDERLVMVDALTWDGLLPFTLTDGHGADCEDIAGWVSEIQRVPGMTADERFIVGRGEFDLGSAAGAEFVRQLEAGVPLGVSFELDAMQTGGVDPEDPAMPDGADPMWMLVVESARIRSLAVTPIAAFAESLITLDAAPRKTPVPAIPGPTPLPADQVPVPDMPEEVVIVAAAGHTITIPRVPPSEWFDEPVDVEIEGALTVTDEGRVYGLLAPAGVPFLGDPTIPGVPMGNVDYSRFLRGEAFVQGGRRVAGNVTMGCGHAKGSTTAAAMEHHENSCAVVAQVNVGERHGSPAGVWVAGALLASATPDQVQRMMACQLSGEWYPRPAGGYELVNALLVPVPAFAMGRRAPYMVQRGGGIAASAVPVAFEDCGCGGHDPGLAERLNRVERELEVERLRRREHARRAAARR